MFLLIGNLIDLELPFLTKKVIICLNILLRFFCPTFSIEWFVVYFMTNNKENNIT